jgi:tetratricopeptide (TPR) repeat protein
MSEESTESAAALELVRQGWSHLQHQRPQAAWAAWQRALRRVPEFPAAKQALETFESALELPAAARAVYRFRPPEGAAARARWNERFSGRAPDDLADAVAAFATLAADDPADAAAAYDEGLCLAWLGRNREAIGTIDRAVRLLASTGFDRAVEAWTLAEVLRQGAGAEALADDLSYAWVIDPADPDVIERLAGIAAVMPVSGPLDPLPSELAGDTELFEWLDRPALAEDGGDLTLAGLPRLLATLVRTPRVLRLSSPDPSALDALEDSLGRVLGASARSIRREAVPLPLPLLDAAVWTFRLPRGLAPEVQNELTRGAVESYYEDRWIHQVRNGLDGLSPLEAAARAPADAILRAKLTAVVLVREQLGARPRTAALYQGYPFDRLRRRLGLELVVPVAVDHEDLTCACGAELDQLDPAALDDLRLADAFESAAGLADDARTVRFAAALARRPAPRLTRLDLAALFAPLVRQAMAAGQPETALDWLDRAHSLEPGPSRGQRTFAIWRAEVQARGGDPDAALATYQDLLDAPRSDAALALDAAETLLDNGYEGHALTLLRQAHDQACQAGDSTTAQRAGALINQL